MSKISELSLTKIVNGIKKKDFTSEEVTKSFIESSSKSKKLNAYITECFDEALKFYIDFLGFECIGETSLFKIFYSVYTAQNY